VGGDARQPPSGRDAPRDRTRPGRRSDHGARQGQGAVPHEGSQGTQVDRAVVVDVDVVHDPDAVTKPLGAAPLERLPDRGQAEALAGVDGDVEVLAPDGVEGVEVAGRRVALLKPLTYMNESGRSVVPAARYFKVAPESLLVVHDEVDLELGRMQARAGGGLGGHNGLRSIVAQFGTDAFLRLRVGVGRPERGDRRPVADFVLSPFEPADDRDAIVCRAADAVEAIARDGLEAAQRRVNERP